IIDHHALLDSVAWAGRYAKAGVSYVAVDYDGRLDMSALSSTVGSDTALISMMWANNEVGTMQPIRQITELAAEHGAISHSDAVQAVGHIDVDFAASGLDLLSFTAPKLGAPYGIGALLARRELRLAPIRPAGGPYGSAHPLPRRELRLAPIMHGGGQERDVRSGPLGVAAVAGFAAALE